MIGHIIEEYVAFGLMWMLFAAWRAIPLAAAACAIEWLTRGRLAARIHCILWSLVLVRMAVAVSVPSSVSIHGHVDHFITHAFSSQSSSASNDQTADYSSNAAAADSVQSIQVSFATPDNPRYEQVTFQSATSPPMTTTWEDFVLYGIVGLWAAVFLLLAFRALVRYARFSLRLRKCPEIDAPSVRDVVLRICDDLKCRNRPRLREVSFLDAPAVFGLWNHTICLPADSRATLSDDEFRFVLRHEIAHIVRRDSWLLTIAGIVKAAHWFNPLAWFAVSRLRAHMELAADELAMASESPDSWSQYAELLVRYATDIGHVPGASNARPAMVGLLFMSGRKRLQKRIQVLGHYGGNKTYKARTIAVALVSGLAIGGLTDAAEDEPAPSSPPDVAWIAPPAPGLPLAQTPPEVEALVEKTYDVALVLRKLRETFAVPGFTPEQYLLSRFPGDGGTAKLEKETLHLMQPESVHRMAENSLEALSRGGAWQVTIECRVIQADLSIARDFDWILPNGQEVSKAVGSVTTVSESTQLHHASGVMAMQNLTAPSANPECVNLATTDRAVSLRPSIRMKISEFQKRLLLNRSQARESSNVMLAPRVTLFNGQLATVSDIVQRPFVMGFDSSTNQNTGDLQPLVQIVNEGWNIQVRPVVIENRQLELSCVMTETEVRNVEMVKLPLQRGVNAATDVTIQVPNVRERSVHSSVVLDAGESLLIASPEAFAAGEEPESPMATFYMLTPTLTSEAELYRAAEESIHSSSDSR